MSHTIVYRTAIVIVAVGTLVVSIYNATQIKEVHLIMNSRLEELLAVTRAASKAEGILQESKRRESEQRDKIVK